jgi:hypothetical protein
MVATSGGQELECVDRHAFGFVPPAEYETRYREQAAVA